MFYGVDYNHLTQLNICYKNNSENDQNLNGVIGEVIYQVLLLGR